MHRDSNLLEQGFRWFGPGDAVPLAFVRQAGAEGVFTSLHEIPYGETWPREQIRARKVQLAAAGLRWSVVESLPVAEGIKTGKGQLKRLFANYAESIRNLAAEGVTTVVYNFMPVLDWIRTDMHHTLADGARCLRYDPAKFCAFEMFVLQRAGAERDYTEEQRERARKWWAERDEGEKREFTQNIIDVFPGVKLGLGVDDIREMIGRYGHLKEGELEENLARFQEAVAPVAEEVGVRLAVHPDDPPFPVLGLPRIVSTEKQVEAMLKRVDSPASGLCFCTGSFSASPANDVVGMLEKFAGKVHAVHLRSTQRLPDGSFYEAEHLGGSVNMPAVMRGLLKEQDRRRAEGRGDWRLTFRPDHGHVMMQDLEQERAFLPGYSGIGRMRGLAELRGLMVGLRSGETVTT